jgi:UPF0755 protein
MDNIEHKIKILSAATGIFLFFVSLSLYFLFSLPDADSFPAGQIITIPSGLNSNEISKILKEKKIIKSVLFFDFLISVLNAEKNIKAGDYVFDSPLSAFEAINKVIDGDFNIQNKKILVKEGATVKEIGKMLEKNGFFPAKEFWDNAGPKFIPKELISLSELLKSKPAEAGLEGYLFPDTYFVPQNISPRGIIEIMIKNMDKKITEEIRKDALKSERSFFEIITMASILEKEAITLEDKKIIAGILWKRLDKGMPLQVDATLQYVTGRNTFELTQDDLNLDSLYNTYKYKGLPLGPIANPGLDSIKAAVYPESSPYWYYLSDKNYNIYYSKNFEEHKIKKIKYL